jgi:hypothetical protein
VGTVGLWAGGNDFGGHGAVTTYMAEPELLGFILRLASMFASAVAIFPVAATVMFAVTAMVVFVLTRCHDGSLGQLDLDQKKLQCRLSIESKLDENSSRTTSWTYFLLLKYDFGMIV